MAAIFISYSRKDVKEVDKLAQLLQESGYIVLRDETFMVSGQIIPHEIIEALGHAQYFLLCHSQYTEKAPWVNWECGIATERARTGQLEMKIIRLDKTVPKAHHALQLYNDIAEFFEEENKEEQKTKVHSILKERRRFLVIKGCFRIAVAVLSIALVVMVAGLVHQRQNTGKQMAYFSQTSRKGDHIGRVFNSSLELTAQSIKQSSDSTILLKLRCTNKGSNEKLIINRKTYLETNGAKAELQNILINGKQVSFDNYEHVLIGAHLEDNEWLEMTLLFFKPLGMKLSHSKLHFHYRKSLYGFGKELELGVDN